jgi:hypothetical protein
MELLSNSIFCEIHSAKRAIHEIISPLYDCKCVHCACKRTLSISNKQMIILLYTLEPTHLTLMKYPYSIEHLPSKWNNIKKKKLFFFISILINIDDSP